MDNESKITIDTTDHNASHGHSPRGRGGWMFSIIDPRKRYSDALAESFTARDEGGATSLTYGEACKAVRHVARMFSFSGVVYVLA